MSKPCDSCPFNDGFTASATEAQNLGCLPTRFDILGYKDGYDLNWHCHSNEKKVCAGFKEERNTETGKSLLYSVWYDWEKFQSLLKSVRNYLT